jgi:hypothetical protein
LVTNKDLAYLVGNEDLLHLVDSKDLLFLVGKLGSYISNRQLRLDLAYLVDSTNRQDPRSCVCTYLVGS